MRREGDKGGRIIVGSRNQLDTVCQTVCTPAADWHNCSTIDYRGNPIRSLKKSNMLTQHLDFDAGTSPCYVLHAERSSIPAAKKLLWAFVLVAGAECVWIDAIRADEQQTRKAQ